MKRLVFGAAALFFASVLAAGAARADHGGMHGGMHGGFHGGFHNGFHHGFFFHDRGDFHHHFFFHHGFFHPFFFGAPFFSEPIALYPPLPYPAYPYGPAYGDAGYGGNCVQFQTTVIINGQPTQAWGTACEQPDGTWRLVY